MIIHGLEDDNTSKVIYRVNVIHIKIRCFFLCRSKKPTLKFIWNLKGPLVARGILKKRGQTPPDFKTHYTAKVISMVLA